MKLRKQIIFFILVSLFAILILSSCGLFTTDTECNHKWGAATCEDPITCKICGAIGGNSRGHSYTSSIVAPTCTEQGYNLNVCSFCGDTVKENYKDKLSHTPTDWIFDKEATDTEPGAKHKECSVCHEVLEYEEILPHSHDLVFFGYKAPDCTTSGHNAYECCSVCGYSNYEEIPATGHNYGEWISEGNGTHSRVCANDTTHKDTAPCSGGEAIGDQLPICDFCGSAYDFGAREGNSTYGYYALGKYPNGAAYQRFYKELQKTAENFVCNNENISGEDGYYIIGEYMCTDYGLTLDEATGVWKIFYLENPAYYWLSTICVTRGYYHILLTIDSDYASAEYRAQCDAAIADMREECALLIDESMSELERAMAIAAYIMSGMEYAYESDGVTPEDAPWAHDIVGFAKYSSGVCETYSKTFLYLSMIHDVDCIIASGYTETEPHAWNYFAVDGVWYGADITWCDNSGDKALYDKFGLSDSVFHADHMLHTSEIFGIDFIYEIPKISNVTMELCELYKGSESIGMYTDIDLAFSAMTDPFAEYEVRIGFYSFFVGTIEHSIDSTTLPGVKKITIVGNNEIVGSGYLDKNSAVHINASLVVSTDLELVNANLKGAGSISIASKKLTLSGNSAYVYMRITGTAAKSEIVVNAKDGAYFFEGVDVYHFSILDGIAVFGKNSHIVYSTADSFYTTTQDIVIDVENRI